MPRFKIEMELTSPAERILLADYNSESSFNTLTFEESFSEEENDLKTLSFRLLEKFGENNSLSFSSYIAIGRPIWLTLYDPIRVIRMAINSYSIEPGVENSIYSIQAQDYASFIFTRNNAGLNLDTALDEEFWDWLEINTELNENEGPGIIDIANHILYRGWLQKRNELVILDGWTVNVQLANIEIEEGVFEPRSDKVHISVSDSNTYNALVELSNISRTFLKFDYINKIVYFIDKENPSYDKNYMLREGSNLQNITVNYNGDSLYSLFYVQGSPNEFGLQTIMNTATPYKDNFLYDFTYFKDKSLLSQSDINNLENAINNIENESSLAYINKKLIEVIGEKYDHLGIIRETESRIQNLSERLIEGEKLSNYIQEYKELVSEFYTRTFEIETSSPEVVTTPWFFANWSSLDSTKDWFFSTPSGNSYYLMNYPISFTYKGEPGVVSSPSDIAKVVVNDLEEYEIKIDLNSYLIDPVQIDGFNAPYLFINEEFQEDPLVYEDLDNFRTHVRYYETVTFGKLKSFYPYLRLLDEYGGDNEIQSKIALWDEKIEQVENWWDEDQSEINEINSKPELTETDEARLALLESRIEDYRRAIGQYQPYSWNISINSNTVKGHYTLIRDLLVHYASEYVNLEKPSIMERYRNWMKTKQEFWYNLKNTYGQHIFLEGYFENNTETSPENLKAQAEAHYVYHNKPNEDFSVTYLDISNIIGKNINEIEVGDFIRIKENIIEQEQNTNSKLQVVGISRNLREFGNIQLTIYRYNKINTILEKIIANSK